MAAATLAFGTSIFLLWIDRPASATVGAVLAIALLLFRFLPIVESFEVFGLKAKLRRQASEGEFLLEKIRRSATVSSKLAYLDLAWMDRLGGIPWSEKRKLLSEADALLEDLDVPKKEIDSLKSVFLAMISVDLVRIFQDCLRLRFSHLSSEIAKEQRAIFGKKPVDQSNPQWKELQEKRRRVSRKGYDSDDLLDDLGRRNVDQITAEMLGGPELSDDDRGKLEAVRAKIAKLSDDCWRAGTITPEAEAFIEEHRSDRDKLYNEAFAKA